MSRAVLLLLLLLLAMAALAECRRPAKIDGSDGEALLKGLTNNSTNLTWDGKAVNLTQNGTAVTIGGTDGTMLLENITRASNTTNLSCWGSVPRKTPPPPEYDYKEAQMISVIRQNHLGY
ncbi:MAG: hypothetical protein A4E48_00381 [Methanosaeta sp. PtaU1.Bin060]|nr:MAG: hypothetical protein A4E48_00381 [Methanosaeta sp. PtaU1.Bin060]